MSDDIDEVARGVAIRCEACGEWTEGECAFCDAETLDDVAEALEATVFHEDICPHRTNKRLRCTCIPLLTIRTPAQA